MSQAMRVKIDADAAAPTIKVYTGAQPANPDTAIGAVTLLATFTLDGTASFVDGAAGTIDLDATPVITATGVAAGTAAWARLADGAGAAMMDGSCGTASADFVMNTTTVSVGLALAITSGSVVVPVG
jgi:hypothetical protein